MFRGHRCVPIPSQLDPRDQPVARALSDDPASAASERGAQARHGGLDDGVVALCTITAKAPHRVEQVLATSAPSSDRLEHLAAAW